jgi:cellulose synthase (UDP-forming)
MLVVVTPLDLRAQILLGAGVFAAALLLGWSSEGNVVTLALVLVSLTVSTRYLFWRLTATLLPERTLESALSYVLFAAELYAYAMLLLGYLQLLGRFPRKPQPLPADVASWPTVDVFIPTFSEPLEVVRTTVLAAKALDWPAEKLRIFLLDDGRRGAFQSFAAAAGVGYIVRTDNAHAKAGNLNHALTKTRGDYIAIFDCDHVPTRSFLQVCMGWFLKDPRMALVQTPHHFYSPDPFERNLGLFKKLPSEGELFYGLIQPSIDLWNASFFCGSCAVIKRVALEDVGGIAIETVTEDAHTALKMHRRGWNSAFLSITQASGLATESLAAHVGQRIRWSRGMAQIFRLDNPLVGRGLTVMQRVSYAAAMLHFFYGLPRIIFLIAPISYPLFGLHIYNALPLMALAYALPHLAHSVLTNSRVAGAVRHSFWNEVYETCLAFYILIPTTVALIAPRRGKFNVTAKGGRITDPYFEMKIAGPYLVIAALNLASMIIGVVHYLHGEAEPDVLALTLGWSAYNLVILCATVAVAWEQRQVRDSPRVNAQLPAMLALQGGRTMRCKTIDLARGGLSLAVPAGREFTPKERMSVSIFTAADELPLPAEVVDCRGNVLRLRFLTLSLEEEAVLAQTIFSRADAWVRWTDGRAHDHPISAFHSITMRGLSNVRQMVRARPPRGGSASGNAPPTDSSPPPAASTSLPPDAPRGAL